MRSGQKAVRGRRAPWAKPQQGTLPVHRTPSPEEQAVQAALRSYQAGHPAPPALVAYGDMVVSVVYRRLRAARVSGPDLRQEGWLGVLEAARRYDFRPENTFASYAAWYVWQAMLRYVMRNTSDRPFAVRERQHDRMQQLRRAWKAHVAKHGRPPTRDEWFAATRAAARKRTERINRVQFEEVVLLLATRAYALDVPRTNDAGEPSFLEIADPHVVDVERCDADQQVARLLATLPARERSILEMRFGFLPRGEWTLADIGRQTGVTKQAIDQQIRKLTRQLAVAFRARTPDLAREYEGG